MQYIFRCILDVEEDVVRDIAICSDKSLQKLHETILQVFGIAPGEMAAFYKTDSSWEQGEEIPLYDVKDAGTSKEMKDFLLSDVFTKESGKMLYVYDFLKMWVFFIELRKITSNKVNEEYTLIFSKGNTPEHAPEKHFTSEKLAGEFEDDIFGDSLEDDYDIDDLNTIY